MQPTIQLSIFHTNDMHGRLEAMSRLSAFARQKREEAAAEGRLTFFWDAGDAADRRLRLCSITKGAAFMPILNSMGYSLQTMGNDLALPYGPQVMAAVSRRAQFPILAANCRNGKGPLMEGLQDSVLIQLPASLKMGVIGLTSPFDNLYELFGLHFPDFFDLARELAGLLRREGASIVILLSHLGIREDRLIAEAIPGIDLIIGAHSHTNLPEGEEVNGILIAQAGQYAEMLGRVELILEAGTGRLLSRKAQVYMVPENIVPDPAVLETISAAEREVDELLLQPVGVLETALDLDHFRECGIGNLAADALRERTGAQAALVASGNFQAGLPAGTITLGLLDAACFSTANPALSEVTGAQIQAALEKGLDPAVSEAKPTGFRGMPYGLPQVSGMLVEFDPDAGPGKRVQRVLIQNEPVNPEQVYRLAHTDAEVSNGLGYLVLPDEQKVNYELPTILREVLEDYLAQHSPVQPVSMGRWKII